MRHVIVTGYADYRHLPALRGDDGACPGVVAALEVRGQPVVELMTYAGDGL